MINYHTGVGENTKLKLIFSYSLYLILKVKAITMVKSLLSVSETSNVLIISSCIDVMCRP